MKTNDITNNIPNNNNPSPPSNSSNFWSKITSTALAGLSKAQSAAQILKVFVTSILDDDIKKDGKTVYNTLTSEKTQKFFKEGLIGQAISQNIGATVAEVGAALVGGKYIGDYLVKEGTKIGNLVGYSIIPLAATAAGAAMISATSPAGQSLIQSASNKLKQLTLLKKVILSMIILTTASTQFQYSPAIAEALSTSTKDSFQFLGSFIGSVIGGFLVSYLTSELSFKEYFQKNLQQTAAVSVINFMQPSSYILANIARDLIYGSLAYNAVPIYKGIQGLTQIVSSERKDVALRIKQYVEDSNKQALSDARKALTDAQDKGEDVTELTKVVKELENKSFIITKLFNNLDTLLRTGFRTFNDYQSILSSEAVVIAQENLVKAYQNEESPTDDIFYDASDFVMIDTSADIITGARSEHEAKKTRARAALSTAIAQEISKKHPLKAAILAPLLRGLSKGFVLPQLADIPEIPDLEKTLLGFSITDSKNNELAKVLIAIHMQQFTALTGLKLFDNAPLTKDDDLNLVQDILGLVNNHYSRMNPTGKITNTVNTVLNTVFTGLREGPRAAYAQLNDKPDFEELSDDDLKDARESDAIGDFEMISENEFPELYQGPLAREASLLEKEDTRIDMLENLEDKFQDAVESFDNDFTMIEMPEETNTDHVPISMPATTTAQKAKSVFDRFFSRK